MTEQNEGGKPEKKLISRRLPIPLLTAINEFTWKNRTDRSSIIEKSCRFYITAVPCPECKNLNPANGKYCSLCGAEFTRPKNWIETVRATTDELMLCQRKLCSTETSFETSLFLLQDIEEDTDSDGPPFLRLQICETELLLKEIQKAILLSDTAEIKDDIREAEIFLQNQDLSLLHAMISRIAKRLAEIEHLEEDAEHLIEYNRQFLQIIDYT